MSLWFTWLVRAAGLVLDGWENLNDQVASNHSEHSSFMRAGVLIGMLMSGYLSNKFRWLAFFATWAVVGIHSKTV